MNKTKTCQQLIKLSTSKQAMSKASVQTVQIQNIRPFSSNANISASEFETHQTSSFLVEMNLKERMANLKQLKNEILSEDLGRNRSNKYQKQYNGFQELTLKSEKRGEEKFQQVFDKYYTEIDSGETSDQASCQEQQFKGDSEQNDALALQYTRQQSSQFYQQSKQQIETEYKKFEQKLAESLTDYKTHYSDWRNTDYVERKIAEETDEKTQEPTMDMPREQIAKAFAVPVLVAMTSVTFVAAVKMSAVKKNAQKNKNVDASINLR